VTASRAVTLVAKAMLVTLATNCAQGGHGNARLASVARLALDPPGRRRGTPPLQPAGTPAVHLDPCFSDRPERGSSVATPRPARAKRASGALAFAGSLDPLSPFSFRCGSAARNV